MTIFFADTSAVAKRYVTEIGSAWVRSWIEPRAGHVIVICDLTKVEMVSLLARRRREGAITASNFTLLQNAFLLHVDKPVTLASADQNLLAAATAEGLTAEDPNLYP